MSTPALAGAPVDLVLAAREHAKAVEAFGLRVRHALRHVIPREAGMNVTLTVVVRKGTIRVDIESQSRDPDWKDASQ